MKNVKKTSSKSKARASTKKVKSTVAASVVDEVESVETVDLAAEAEDLRGADTGLELGEQTADVPHVAAATGKVSAVVPVTAPAADREVLKLALSQSLLTKLSKTAQDEGIGLESFASELIAEGLVLRAWEIAERKNTMRNLNGGTQTNFGRSHNNNGNHRNDNRRQRHGNNNNAGGGRRSGQNNNWMEDKAAFLEYVRNQEKRRR